MKVRQGDNPFTPGGYGEVPTCNVCSASIKADQHEDGCTWLPVGYWADESGRWGIHPDPHNPDSMTRIEVGTVGSGGFHAARKHWEEALFTYRGYRNFTPDTFGCDKRRMSFLEKPGR